jgi:hypothetical protein
MQWVRPGLWFGRPRCVPCTSKEESAMWRYYVGIILFIAFLGFAEGLINGPIK